VICTVYGIATGQRNFKILGAGFEGSGSVGVQG